MAKRFEQSDKSEHGSGRGYWRLSLRLVAVCLVIWLFVTLIPLALAQMGVTGKILGWPGVFAVAAFGVPVVYLLIIGLYSVVMDRIERDEQTKELGP